MSLSRYTPNSLGMSELRTSKMVGDAMENVAAQMQSQASSRGNSTYEARGRRVRGGYKNTERAGAEVTETQRHFYDVRNQVLVNIARDFRMR